MGRNISCNYAGTLVVGKAIIEAAIISYYRTSATEHDSAACVIITSVAGAALGQNGRLMSVRLNAGKSEVDWTYRPWWFVPGMLGWLIGILFLLSTALPDRWRHSLTWKLWRR